MPEQPTDFLAALRKALDEQMRFIAANRERLVEAWVAETGFLPSESELVEQRNADGSLTVYVRRKAGT